MNEKARLIKAADRPPVQPKTKKRPPVTLATLRRGTQQPATGREAFEALFAKPKAGGVQ